MSSKSQKIKTTKSHAKNVIHSLAAQSPREMRMLMSELYGELLFANEGRGKIILQSTDIVEELRRAIGHSPDEKFAVVFMDHGKMELGRKVYENGSRTKCILFPRQLFKDALEADATGIILAHNHPGGTVMATNTDRELTRRVQETGRILEIDVIDHLIITNENYASFKENGWL